MKIKLRVAALDGLPKELQSLYRQMEGGGFILDYEPDPDGYGIDNLAALRGKIEEKDRDYQRANKHLQGFKKPDGSLYTAEEIEVLRGQNADLTKSVDTLRDKTKTDEQKLAQLVAEAKKPLEAQLAASKAKIDGYQQRVHRAEKDRVVQMGLDTLKPQDRWRPFIAAELARQIEIREGEDGALSHVVLDGEGRARMSSLTGRNGPMDVAELVSGADIRQKFGDLLVGDNKKGANIMNPVSNPNAPPSQPGERNVHLPYEHTQKQFEAAFEQAAKQGGEVVIAREDG